MKTGIRNFKLSYLDENCTEFENVYIFRDRIRCLDEFLRETRVFTCGRLFLEMQKLAYWHTMIQQKNTYKAMKKLRKNLNKHTEMVSDERRFQFKMSLQFKSLLYRLLMLVNKSFEKLTSIGGVELRREQIGTGKTPDTRATRRFTLSLDRSCRQATPGARAGLRS